MGGVSEGAMHWKTCLLALFLCWRTTPGIATDAPTTAAPSDAPSNAPSDVPSNSPSNSPSNAPSVSPTNAPSHAPSASPSNAPSVSPTNAPSHAPSASPSNAPSFSPTNMPSYTPTASPSLSPTAVPTMRHFPRYCAQFTSLVFPYKPALKRIKSNSADISIQLSAAGKVWCVKKPSHVTNGPTGSQVKSQGTMVTVDMACADHLVTIAGLSADTKYKIYCYGEDMAGTTNTGTSRAEVMKTKMVITTTPTSYSELYTSGRVAGYERVPPNTGRVFGYNTELGVGWAAGRVAEDRSPTFRSFPATPLPDPGAKHLHEEEQAARGGVPIIPGSADMRLHTGFYAEWQDI